MMNAEMNGGAIGRREEAGLGGGKDAIGDGKQWEKRWQTAAAYLQRPTRQ